MASVDDLRIRQGTLCRLADFDPDLIPSGLDRKPGEKAARKLIKRLAELQNVLYAGGKRSLLVIFQGMDAAGKDGTIRNVFGPVNPQGCRVTSFKVPSKNELAHDFLWRCHKAAPASGHIAVFNRSHYEDVLVVRVHDLVDRAVWSRRYDLINDFEVLLAHRGTKVLKFFLHISHEEQLRRFKKRIDNPGKNWKISLSDYTERPLWGAYTEAFEEALSRCSTDSAPWYVIPANHKWSRNLTIAEIVVAALEEMELGYPEPSVDMGEIRTLYRQAEEKLSRR